MKKILFSLVALCGTLCLIGQEARLFLPIAEQKFISYMEFSHDGSKLLTTGEDQSVKFWNLVSGVEVACFVHNSSVKRASFSPDDQRLITFCYWDDTVRVWDVRSQRELFYLLPEGEVETAVFSPDNQYILTYSRQGNADLWDASSGTHLFTVDTKLTWGEAYFSPDGQSFTVRAGNGARSFSTAKGSLLKKDKDDRSFLYSFLAKLVLPADVRKVADSLGRSLLNRSDLLAVSPDKKKIAVYRHEASSVDILDGQTGKKIIDLKKNGYAKPLYRASFSPNGSMVITTNGSAATLWDIYTGSVISQAKASGTYARFTGDGRNFITSRSHGEAIQKKNAKAAWFAYISLDENYVFRDYTILDSSVALWSCDSARKLAGLETGFLWLNDASFSPDGSILAAPGEVKKWDYNKARFFDSRSDSLKPLYDIESKWGFRQILFSSDNRRFATIGPRVQLWDALTGKQLPPFDGDSFGSFSPDGTSLVTGGEGRQIKIVDVQTGTVSRRIDMPFYFANYGLYSSDGSKIAIGYSGNPEISVLDASDYHELFRLKGHLGDISSIEFSPDATRILTASDDGTAKLWNARTGELLYTFFTIDNTEYLVVDKFNQYDGTERARKLLYFTCGAEVVGLDQVKRLHVTQLAERIMRGEPVNSARIEQLDICGVAPAAEIVFADTSEYRIRIKPGAGGLGETVLKVNNIELTRFGSDQLTKVADGFELRVKKQLVRSNFVAGQKNEIAVKAYTRTGDISSNTINATEVDHDALKIGNVYAVMIGVNDYKDERTLSYPVDDAVAMSSLIGSTAREWFNMDGKEHVFVYNIHTGANRQYFPERETIRKLIAEIGARSQPEDILLIFFSGHGRIVNKELLLLTAESMKDAPVGISSTDLFNWTQPSVMRAQKRVLILDACESGQIVKDIREKMPDGWKIKGDNLDDRVSSMRMLNEKSGMLILCASASGQKANEFSQYSHGVLTYALLKTARDMPQLLRDNRFLNVSTWFAKAETMVDGLARKGLPGADISQDALTLHSGNFDIGIITDKIRSSIVLKSKPVFNSVILQNNDRSIRFDDIGLNSAIINQFRQLGIQNITNTVSFNFDDPSPEAFSINGGYDVKGQVVTVEGTIRNAMGEVFAYKTTGRRDEVQELAAKVVKKAVELLQDRK